MKSAIFTLTVIFIHLQTADCTTCPSPEDIEPCSCDDEGLRCLELTDEQLEQVFRASAAHKAIRRVWIFKTELSHLSPGVFGDYIIRDLYLDINQIATIEPGAFGRAVETLQAISVTRNQLKSFPFADLSSMKKLSQLALGFNQITSIEAQAFAPSSLKYLDISHNLIAYVGENAFVELVELSMIDLSWNRLTDIRSRALNVKSHGGQLVISLRANQISKLATDAFGGHYPNNLDLSRNKLSYLDEYVFMPLLKDGTVVDVDENPFTCYGCDLYRWLVKLNQNHKSNLLNFACIDGKQIEDLTLESIGC